MRIRDAEARLRIAIIHGYFLHDSGSAIYTRELAREFTRQGHEVTLVCQEQNPADYDFIDAVFDLDAANALVTEVSRREPVFDGRCRLVRPDIGGRMLTYVAGPFPGFEAVPFQDAQEGWIDDYVAANVRALRAVFNRWPPDFVQTNHVVMQPYVASRALEGSAPYVVTVHGSELNFTINRDDRMVPYALDGLEDAAAVFALSPTSLAEVTGFAGRHGLDIKQKASELPPGVDTNLFIPRVDRADLLRQYCPSLSDHEPEEVAVFAGRLLWTKGLHYVVAALPMILAERSGLHLLVAGSGPLMDPLEALIGALEAGDFEQAQMMTAQDPELQMGEGYGEVLPELTSVEKALYLEGARNLRSHIHFLGHLSHDRLAGIFAAADISLAPSVFPEAFGLVSIEAMAAGAFPLATYQTGLRAPLDALAGYMKDDFPRNLRPGVALTTALAGSMMHVLDNLPVHDLYFREGLHGLARELFSWEVVASRMLSAADG